MLPLAIALAVGAALREGRAVVALETTVVTHGLPHPDGVEVALEMESAVRGEGAMPATIGVLGGSLIVGLDAASLSRLATTPGVAKLNPANLAACLVEGRSGSTTVAATLVVARLAGIRVFATGGIGGVHRNVEATGDISADLTALARTPVVVVCAGAKAVLDLPRTVEALETLGVPTYGFGVTNFPAFYRRDSGLPLDAGFDDLEALARAAITHLDLETGTGVLVANPVPPEAEMPEPLYDRALGEALEKTAKSGIRGRAVTPFLLEQLLQRTAGASVITNRALLVHNARVAGRLAVAMSGLAAAGRR